MQFCNDWITFKLLTQPNITADVLKKCVRLQKIITALDPQKADAHKRLAYFYGRLSMFDEAVGAMQAALNLEPDNREYQTNIKQYTILQKTKTRR